MRGGIETGDRLVERGRNDLVADRDDGADGHLVDRESLSGFGKRRLHEDFMRRRHRSWNLTACVIASALALRLPSSLHLETFEERITMRRHAVTAFAVALVLFGLTSSNLTGQGQKPGAPTAPVNSPTSGDYDTADIRVLTPGVVFSSGMPDLAAEFTKQTGKKVGINVIGMGTIVSEMQKRTPPPDVIVLPFQLMTTLALDGGVAGAFIPLGRNRMGLAVRAGAPKPDISTVEKLAAVLKSAKAVMRSNPASRTMVATLIDDVLKRPEFAGVNAPASTNGEGGQALARGDGDMAIQTISQILPYKEIELVGPLPAELGAWIDTGIAVSARATHAEDAKALIRYLLRPESNTTWKPKGLERFE
jgi:molybdate transport system substrate-binding protein